MQKLKFIRPTISQCGFFLFLLLIMILTACSGAAPEEALSVEEQAGEAEPIEEVSKEAEVEVVKEIEVEAVVEEEMAEEMAEDAADPISATGSEDEDGSPHLPESTAKAEPTRVAAEVALADTEVRLADEVISGEIPAASELTAGEIDDNENWDDYLLYLRQYDGPEIIWVDVVERHTLTVLDGNNRPVAGEKVDLLANGQLVRSLRTHSDGTILIFPKTFDLSADATTLLAQLVKTGDSVMMTLGGQQRDWELTADSYTSQSEVKLDVHFLIDTTGSMADEINQLRDNMIAISQQIDSLPAAPDVRYGMTLYRDRGDEYVTQSVDFTPDLATFLIELNRVEADGGGDYPEDLTEGLFRAIEEPEWRVENTVSLIFLIADAPPHLDYGDQTFNYAAHAGKAAELGIKIFSIASSGLDQQGEYVFRQMAQTTGGRFIFLTYGAGGPGTTGDQTGMAVDPDDFTVEALDDLIVQIIEEELSYR